MAILDDLMTNILGRMPVCIVALLGALISLPLQSHAASEAQELVDKSRITVEKLLADPDFTELKPYVKRAHAVLVIPQLIKGGFIIGGEGGSGTLLAKGTDGSWSPPAFYTLAAGSIGLQIGGQVSEIIFTVMNEGALNAMLEDQVKFGGDVSIAVGPVGKSLEASATTNLKADVYAFAKSEGLFGGAAFKGAAVFAKEELNRAYYGEGAIPTGILIDRKFFNERADALRQALPSGPVQSQ